MIFPFLAGILHPLRAPMTYFFLFINVMVYLVTLETSMRTDRRLDEIIYEKSFQETQGAAFAQMIERERASFGETFHALAPKALNGDSEARQALGALAIHNYAFMSRAENYEFKGDDVALEKWRAKFKEVLALQEEDPTFRWGLTKQRSDWMQWFSYQFAHSGFEHLFWNMVFLMIFGCFIEAQLGGSLVVLAYVGGGLVAAGVFALLSGLSAAPIVGASGAISGLMGLVAFHWWGRERVRFAYALLFRHGYYGFALLPSWLVFICFLVPDLAGYISSSSEIGGFAYSAHLGGAIFGGVMALGLRWGLLVRDTEDDLDHDVDDDDLDDDIEREERDRAG